MWNILYCLTFYCYTLIGNSEERAFDHQFRDLTASSESESDNTNMNESPPISLSHQQSRSKQEDGKLVDVEEEPSLTKVVSQLLVEVRDLKYEIAQLRSQLWVVNPKVRTTSALVFHQKRVDVAVSLVNYEALYISNID